MDPPTLLVCLDHRSGTLSALRETGGFGVALLHTGGRRTAELFAAPVADRFAGISWRPSPALAVPWPTEDTLALAECRVAGFAEVGDHEVVFGQVATVVDGEGTRLDPLLYGQRMFGSWRSASQVTQYGDHSAVQEV
ncbi:hypothetical protein GCM10027589_15090 [Actinocorallia lasiicapitis]